MTDDAPDGLDCIWRVRCMHSRWFDSHAYAAAVGAPPSNAVEQLAMALLPLTGQEAEIVGCSWCVEWE